MAEPSASILRLPIRPPVVGAPPRYAERRGADRREKDRLAHEEAALLARVLDILAADTSGERRLAGVLDLLAVTAGARRAAVLSGDPERRVAVTAETATGLADPTGAHELAAWLDANAPRSRAERAASGPAVVTVVRGRAQAAGPLAVAADVDRAPDARFASLDIPAAGRVTLGFEMDDEDGVLALAHRLPPTLARHAAVALALVTGQLAASAELDALRAHEVGARAVRLDGGPRPAIPADRAGRLPGPDPRGPGERPGDRRRVPRAEPADRGVDDRPRGRPARDLEARRGQPAPRDRPVLGGRGGRTGGRRAGSDRPRPADRPADRAATPDAGRGRGSSSRGADRHEPPRQRPEVRGPGRDGGRRRTVRRTGRDPGRPRRRSRASRRPTGRGSSSASSGSTAMPRSPERVSGWRSPAIWPGR